MMSQIFKWESLELIETFYISQWEVPKLHKRSGAFFQFLLNFPVPSWLVTAATGVACCIQDPRRPSFTVQHALSVAQFY